MRLDAFRDDLKSRSGWRRADRQNSVSSMRCTALRGLSSACFTVPAETSACDCDVTVSEDGNGVTKEVAPRRFFSLCGGCGNGELEN